MESQTKAQGKRLPIIVERMIIEPCGKPFADTQGEKIIKESGFTDWEIDVLQRMAMMIRGLSKLMFPTSRPPAIWCLDSETDLTVVATVKWFIGCLTEGCNYWEKILDKQLDDTLQAKEELPPLWFPLDIDRARIQPILELWTIKLRNFGEQIRSTKIVSFEYLYDHFYASIWRQLSLLMQIEPDHPLATFYRLLLPIQVHLRRSVEVLRQIEDFVGLLQREHERCVNRHHIYDSLQKYAPKVSPHIPGFIGWYARKVEVKEEERREAKDRQKVIMHKLHKLEQADGISPGASFTSCGLDSISDTSASFSTIAEAANTFPDFAQETTAHFMIDDSLSTKTNETHRASHIAHAQEVLKYKCDSTKVDEYHSGRPIQVFETMPIFPKKAQVCESRHTGAQKRSPKTIQTAMVDAKSVTCANKSFPLYRDSIQSDQPLSIISGTTTGSPINMRSTSYEFSNSTNQEASILVPSRNVNESANYSSHRRNANEPPRIITGSFGEIESKLSSMQLEPNRQVSICSSGIYTLDDEVHIRDFATAPTSPLCSALPSPTTLLKRSNAQSYNTFEWEQRMLNGEIVRYRRPEKGRGRANTIDDRTDDIEKWLAKPRAGERVDDMLPPLHRKNTI